MKEKNITPYYPDNSQTVKWKDPMISFVIVILNSSPPGQNGRHVADDIFRCIFANETFCILIKILLKFVPKGPIDNNPALF